LSAFADAREAVALDLEALYPGRKVYRWYPPGAPVVPCIIVAPDETTPVEASGHSRYNYQLKITAISSAQIPEANAVEALEDDLETLLIWAGPIARDINIGPARYGDATVYAVGLSIPYPVKIPAGD
jgi:hypothetical protein